MSRILPALLAAAALFGGALQDHEPDGWLDDIDAATALARESGRPLLLVFR